MSVCGVASGNCTYANNSSNAVGASYDSASKSQIGTLQAQLSQLQQTLVKTQCSDTQSVISQQIASVQQRIATLQAGSTVQVDPNNGNVTRGILGVNGVSRVSGASDVYSVSAIDSRRVTTPSLITDSSPVDSGYYASITKNSTTATLGNNINTFT